MSAHMSKKHYELIASAVDATRPTKQKYPEKSEYFCHRSQWRDMAHELAEALEAQDPRFDRYKFLEDCGVEG